jgi:hypothetical protein
LSGSDIFVVVVFGCGDGPDGCHKTSECCAVRPAWGSPVAVYFFNSSFKDNHHHHPTTLQVHPMALYALHTTSPPRNTQTLFPLLEEANIFAPTSTAHRKASIPTRAPPEPPPHGKNPVLLPVSPPDSPMCFGVDTPPKTRKPEPRKPGPRRSEPRRSKFTEAESSESEPESRKPEPRRSESTKAESVEPKSTKPNSSKTEPTQSARKLAAWKCPTCSHQNKGSHRHCVGKDCRTLDPRRKPAKGTLLSKCCGCRHLSKRFNEACSKCAHQQEGCDRCSVVRVGGSV